MNDKELLEAIEHAARTGAESLDLSGQGLTALPPEIGQLTNLTTLVLTGNQLTALPPEIGNLTSLTALNLFDNQLTALPPEIGGLAGLTVLILDSNPITALPTEIGNLSRLEKLGLWHDQLTALPSEIGQLTSLTDLNLWSNQLAALPIEIGQLTNLISLHLGANHITILPPEIGQLTSLTSLDLNSNQFTALLPQIGHLANLKKLDLQNNQLTSLPPEIRHLANLTELDLRGNKLPVPPEILVAIADPAGILNYYFTHLSGDTRPLNEAKMLIVGQGGVGKTSLVKRLMDDDYDPQENKTEGIDIRGWLVNCDGTDIKLNVWDFGGQEIMHATHQFFMTKRSLYVLVLDARQGEQESRIEYWLKLIQSFGGDSPVIVVCNKSDQQEMDLDWAGLQSKYPAIKGFARKVSCEIGEGIPELRSMIEREVAHLEHIHDQMLISWFEVKTKLENMREDGDDYISYDRYQELCAAENITEEESPRTLVGFLHDLGIVLHFDDHPILGDTNILNPEWVTKGVYQIINSDLLAQNKGVLGIRDLRRMLKPAVDYPRSKHLFITEMMRKFELCFDFPGQANQRFLVPDLLPKEQPDTGNWEDSLAFEYHYDVLPGSIISRFIVAMKPFIFRDTYWRNGVVLEYEMGRNKALVRADLEDKKVFIRVDGNEATRRTFLGVIRADLQRIHQSISGLAVQQKVAVPGHPGVAVDYDHLLTLEELRMDEYLPEGMREPVNVKRLLDGVEPEEARLELRQSSGYVINAKTVVMSRDHYTAQEAAAIGPGARAENVSFDRIWNQVENTIDLPALVEELTKVQQQMLADASKPHDYAAVGEVVRAQEAARDRDGPGMLRYMKSAGKFALDVGSKIGADLAVAAAKAGLGI